MDPYSLWISLSLRQCMQRVSKNLCDLAQIFEHFIIPSSVNHLAFIVSHCIDVSPFLQFSEIRLCFNPVFHNITRFNWVELKD